MLLAYKLNGEVLEEGYSFPVRLVVPSKYAYKSALWVEHLKLTRGKEWAFGNVVVTVTVRTCGKTIGSTAKKACLFAI